LGTWDGKTKTWEDPEKLGGLVSMPTPTHLKWVGLICDVTRSILPLNNTFSIIGGWFKTQRIKEVTRFSLFSGSNFANIGVKNRSSYGLSYQRCSLMGRESI